MSLTFGYDLKDNDKISEAPNQLANILRPLAVPGRGALINLLPFCAGLDFTPACSVSWPFQCGTSLHGSHTSATNH